MSAFPVVRIMLILLSLCLPLTAGEPIPAKFVTIEDHPRTLAETMAFLTKQSGLAIDTSKVDGSKSMTTKRAEPQPFWNVLEQLAAKSEYHIELGNAGKLIALKPGTSTTPTSIDGPFRIVVRSVQARQDFQLGRAYYDVMLDIHWEPRFPVFRIDSQPTITNAVDDHGVKLTSSVVKTKNPVGDSFIMTSGFRIEGLTRESKSIAKLEGSFAITASPKMLAFTFDDLNAKLPITKEQDTVSVTLTKLNAVKARYDAEFKLVYPESHPLFESFESWADGNKAKLISPDRTKTYDSDNFAISGSGRKLNGEYRFFSKAMEPVIADRKGWTLVYETPAPLTEFFVKFSLKDITLP